MRVAEGAELTGVGGVHRRLELALVGLQRGQLAVDELGDVLDVVRLVGLQQQQRRGAMRGEAVLGEEVRIAGGDDRVAHEPTGVAVIGMEPVALPRVVTEHDVGPQLADDPGDLGDRRPIARQVAVDVPEEAHLAGAVTGQPAGRLALLVLAARHELRQVGRRVPRALGTVGAHEVVDDAAGRRPLGQRAAGAELDVVGMGGDGQRRRRDGPVARPRPGRAQWRLSRLVRSHVGRWGRSAGWVRSSGLSTSSASRGSPRTSTR